MSDKNPFSPGAVKTAWNNPSDDHWHDLVAAVVATRGSPPVRPPAAMFTEIERKLGFVSAHQGWLRVPLALGGVAAALVFTLGWLAWRANYPGERDDVLASARQGEVKGSQFTATDSGGHLTATSQTASTPMAVPASVAAKAMTKSTAGSSAIVAGVGALSEKGRTMGETAFAAPFGRGGLGEVEARASIAGTTLPTGAVTRLTPGKETIDLKNDYYVAGMIAAAMQNPATANPYEPVSQPEEWSDWVSGYELGSEIPPSEALALGASWKWSDPGTLSLVAGAPVDEADTAASVTSSAIAIEEPKQSAASRVSEGNATAQGLVE